jgi:hypothetical protein
MNTNANMINNDEMGWTQVKPKYKSKKPTNDTSTIQPTKLDKKLRREEEAKNKKPLSLEEIKAKHKIPSHFRPLEKHDYTLAPEEEENFNNSDVHIYCTCCQAEYIESIIKRPFTCCHTCYCCAGNEGCFGAKNVSIFTNENLREALVIFEKMAPNYT